MPSAAAWPELRVQPRCRRSGKCRTRGLTLEALSRVTTWPAGRENPPAVRARVRCPCTGALPKSGAGRGMCAPPGPSAQMQAAGCQPLVGLSHAGVLMGFCEGRSEREVCSSRRGSLASSEIGLRGVTSG